MTDLPFVHQSNEFFAHKLREKSRKHCLMWGTLSIRAGSRDFQEVLLAINKSKVGLG
jgi:hypothetical protein